MESRGVDVVLDVGANAGQYGELLRERGYAGRLVSLEPVAEAYAELERRAAADGAWEAHPRGGLRRRRRDDAQRDGATRAAAPCCPATSASRTSRAGSRRRPQARRRRRLDGLVRELLRAGERAYLKLDVQGYERQVLAGAGDALATASRRSSWS